MSGTVSQLLDELGRDVILPPETSPRTVNEMTAMRHQLSGQPPPFATLTEVINKNAGGELTNDNVSEGTKVNIKKVVDQQLGASFDKYGTLLRVRNSSPAYISGLGSMIGFRLLCVNDEPFSYMSSFDVIRRSSNVSLELISPLRPVSLSKSWEIFIISINNLNIKFEDVIDASPDDRISIIKEVMPDSAVLRAQVNTKWTHSQRSRRPTQ